MGPSNIAAARRKRYAQLRPVQPTKHIEGAPPVYKVKELPAFLRTDPRFHFGDIPRWKRFILAFVKPVSRYACDDGVRITIKCWRNRWYVLKDKRYGKAR